MKWVNTPEIYEFSKKKILVSAPIAKCIKYFLTVVELGTHEHLKSQRSLTF